MVFDRSTGVQVFYHRGCWDGLAAAWVAYRGLQGPGALSMTAVRHDESLKVPEDVATIFCLDFCPLSEQLDQWVRTTSAKIVILDHHDTAFRTFPIEARQAYHPSRVKFVLSKQNSGAGITWQYFFPHEDPPNFIQMIEDRDLFRFALVNTKVFRAWLNQQPQTFETLDNIPDLSIWYPQGVMVMQLEAQDIKRTVQQAFNIRFQGFEIKAVNCVKLISDVLAELAATQPFALSFFVTSNKVVCSLRSASHGVDVERLAARFGGGGHTHSAAFTLPLDSLGALLRGEL